MSDDVTPELDIHLWTAGLDPPATPNNDDPDEQEETT